MLYPDIFSEVLSEVGDPSSPRLSSTSVNDHQLVGRGLAVAHNNRISGPGPSADSEEFDLVYSTGLFDYLNPRTGRRLVTGMFQLLRSGGSLIVANFLPGVRDIGYMETYMGWKLIYRTPEQMQSLADEIPRAQIAAGRVFWDEHHNIVFLSLTRT